MPGSACTGLEDDYDEDFTVTLVRPSSGGVCAGLECSCYKRHTLLDLCIHGVVSAHYLFNQYNWAFNLPLSLGEFWLRATAVQNIRVIGTGTALPKRNIRNNVAVQLEPSPAIVKLLLRGLTGDFVSCPQLSDEVSAMSERVNCINSPTEELVKIAEALQRLVEHTICNPSLSTTQKHRRIRPRFLGAHERTQ